MIRYKLLWAGIVVSALGLLVNTQLARFSEAEAICVLEHSEDTCAQTLN